MTPHQLQRHHIAKALRNLLCRSARAIRTRRLQECIRHHDEQAEQIQAAAAAAAQAAEWHRRQAAIATANLRSEARISEMRAANTETDGRATAWATPRMSGVIMLCSAGTVTAAAWHLATAIFG